MEYLAVITPKISQDENASDTHEKDYPTLRRIAFYNGCVNLYDRYDCISITDEVKIISSEKTIADLLMDLEGIFPYNLIEIIEIKIKSGIGYFSKDKLSWLEDKASKTGDMNKGETFYGMLNQDLI